MVWTLRRGQVLIRQPPSPSLRESLVIVPLYAGLIISDRGKVIPERPDDWTWIAPGALPFLQASQDMGCTVILWAPPGDFEIVRLQVDQVLAAFRVQPWVILGMPAPSWVQIKSLVSELLPPSFYCGPESELSQLCGLPRFDPLTVYPELPLAIPPFPEMVLLMGPPGIAQGVFVALLLTTFGYTRVTTIQQARQTSGKLVVDTDLATAAKRRPYQQVAQQKGLPVRLVILVSMTQDVPDQAQRLYTVEFERPTEDEGEIFWFTF